MKIQWAFKVRRFQAFSLFLLLPTVFLSIGYQNCGQGSFQELSSISDKSTSASSFNIAERYLRELEPSIAVRAPACITCHANISSNFITDFGYGDPYFFGGAASSPITWNSGAVYGDHGSSLSTMTLNGDAQVIVPRTQLPAAVQTATGLGTVEQYVVSQLKPSSDGAPASTRVATKSKITIAAPTEAQILRAFNASSSGPAIVYRRYDGLIETEVKGLQLSLNGKYISNTSQIECEGDVLINGVLLLENPLINTQMGCRLYVTRSVFFQGNLTYVGPSEYKNLQITSARAINLGLGTTKINNDYCEPSSWFVTNGSTHGDSSIVARYRDIWTKPSHFTRGYRYPGALGEAVIADAHQVGILRDAECQPEGRMVNFEHILLNAPEVHSRYQGLFRGTVIAEFALFSLSAFNFEFDPVFSSVEVLPLLKDLEILQAID